MYRYDDYDHAIVQARVAQFRNQTRRYLAGELSDDAFRPLRLQNGLYQERHGPMLRHRPHLQAEPRAAQNKPEPGEDQQAKDKDIQSIVRNR